MFWTDACQYIPLFLIYVKMLQFGVLVVVRLPNPIIATIRRQGCDSSSHCTWFIFFIFGCFLCYICFNWQVRIYRSFLKIELGVVQIIEYKLVLILWWRNWYITWLIRMFKVCIFPRHQIHHTCSIWRFNIICGTNWSSGNTWQKCLSVSTMVR